MNVVLRRLHVRLREALLDNAETPRFIETLPKRGYRFLVPVQPVERYASAPAAPSSLLGRRLGHYLVEERIGAGGMGVVYRAHDEHLDRKVALKVLPPHALDNDDARRRFRKESLALAQVQHPNIAAAHDFDAQDGVDFLAMEFVEGDTLAKSCRRGRWRKLKRGRWPHRLLRHWSRPTAAASFTAI